MRITINSGEIPQEGIKCVTYDDTSNLSKVIFSMNDKESAQKMSLTVTNLLGLIGHYNRLFKPPILSTSVVDGNGVRFVIGNKINKAIEFLQNIGIITADLSQIVLKRINEGQEIEDISIVEVTPQS